MDAEQGRPEAPSRKIRRISAYRFLALLILPAALLLGVAGLAVFLSLDTIRQITDSLEEEHLPGILDSQRTVDNINVLRSEAAVVFMAEDPDQRRAARLKGNLKNTKTGSYFPTRSNCLNNYIFQGTH